MAQGRPKKQVVLKDDAPLDFSEAALPDLVGRSIASASSQDYSRGNTPLSGSICNYWPNIEGLGLPFGTERGYYTIREAVIACQKAYYRIGIFKTAVDTMAELCNTPLHFYEGNTQSLKFFQSWDKKIGGWKLRDQFFRECFRSGNIFLYRADLTLKADEVLKLSQTYAKKIEIPGRYIMLNPATLCAQYFETGVPIYAKVLTKLELDQIKSADGDEPSIYKDIKSAINQYAGGIGSTGQTIIKLDPDKLHTVFYQKQDYEPFAVPMGYCALDDINLLLEMKKADLIVSKSVEYMMLLVTMGAKKEDGGTNPKAMEMLKAAFKKDQLGRALVADYTTKAEFITPDLSKIIIPQKYDEIKTNIANSLSNIYFGEDKFASIMAKIKVYTKKLEGAQKLFINEFLQPEIKRISKLLNFKAYPKVEFEPINLEDNANFLRIAAQLLQMGVLTPKDGLELMETGLYPTSEDLLTNQEEFRKQKDKGLFEPIVGGPFSTSTLQEDGFKNQVKQTQLTQEHDMKIKTKELKHKADNPEQKPPQIVINGQPGRPGGTKSPQTKKTVKPAKASLDEELEGVFSQRALIENTALAYKLEDIVTEEFKKANPTKRLTKSQKELIANKTSIIIESVPPSEWETYARQEELPKMSIENQLAIIDIQTDYDIEDNRMASLLFHSKI